MILRSLSSRRHLYIIQTAPHLHFPSPDSEHMLHEVSAEHFAQKCQLLYRKLFMSSMRIGREVLSGMSRDEQRMIKAFLFHTVLHWDAQNLFQRHDIENSKDIEKREGSRTKLFTKVTPGLAKTCLEKKNTEDRSFAREMLLFEEAVEFR